MIAFEHPLPKAAHDERTARLLRQGAASLDMLLAGMLTAIRFTGPIPKSVTEAADTLAWEAVRLHTLADELKGGGDADS